MLREQFGVATLDGFGLAGHPHAVSAAGAVVHYLRETSAMDPENGNHSGAALGHLDRVRYYEQADALVLDAVTVRNLELVAPHILLRMARAEPLHPAFARWTKRPPAWVRGSCGSGSCARR